jgi:hypothetical protein
MPKGIPNKGYRNKSSAEKVAAIKVDYSAVSNETDEEIEARLGERFEILDTLTEACTVGNARSLIVSGPAGLGKSYTVEERLKAFDPNEVNSTIAKGYVRATGLVKLLYQFRHPGMVIVFDDADAIFFDDISLNLLKAVCDTTERRRVSWLSEGKLIDEETAELIPRTFDFEGSIIFISNYDFDAMIDRGHKLAPHLQAMISRSHYIDLSMKTRRDYLVRIRQVVKQGLLNFLNANERKEVTEFINKNNERLRELSLRMALKIGSLRKQSPENWERLATVTCCKNN